jgi:cysteine-rich repeat protein
MRLWNQSIARGAGIGAVVICLDACVPFGTVTTDTEDDDDSESSSSEDGDDTTTTDPPLPPTTTEDPEETTGTTEPTSSTTGPTTSSASCGDGEVDGDEVCDDGTNDGSYGGCMADCSAFGPSCGDAELNGPEVCDDGTNDGSYGGCMADCSAPGPYCGDGNPDDVEECDDANDDDTDECTSACAAAVCGDGFVQDGLGEVCDDAVNDGSYGGCSADCTALGPYCGDGNVDAGDEGCDDQNADNQDGCLTTCEIPFSCAQILEADPASMDGVYGLVSGDTTWQAYCDMTTDGGGWTLAAKAPPTTGWAYSNIKWTDSNTFVPANSDFDHKEAKLATWMLTPFTQIHLGMEPYVVNNQNPPAPRYITIDAPAESLYSLFSPGEFVETSATRATWETLVDPPSLTENCNLEGINNTTGDTTPRVRLGILANTEDDCASPDSVIGVGLGNFPSFCSNNPVTTGGNLNCEANPVVKSQQFSWIFVR